MFKTGRSGFCYSFLEKGSPLFLCYGEKYGRLSRFYSTSPRRQAFRCLVSINLMITLPQLRQCMPQYSLARSRIAPAHLPLALVHLPHAILEIPFKVRPSKYPLSPCFDLSHLFQVLPIPVISPCLICLQTLRPPPLKSIPPLPPCPWSSF